MVRVPAHLPVCVQPTKAIAVQRREVQQMKDRMATVDDLCDYLRKRMPVRARAAGQARFTALVREIVREWPSEQLRECAGVGNEKDVLKQLGERVSRGYTQKNAENDRYGCGVLLLFVLSTCISLLFQWWLSRNANKCKLVAWQSEMRGGL